jgi:hypothetical protein
VSSVKRAAELNKSLVEQNFTSIAIYRGRLLVDEEQIHTWFVNPLHLNFQAAKQQLQVHDMHVPVAPN